VPRKDITMAPADIEAFLQAGRVAQVATLGEDDWPHLVPMWYIVEDGRIVFRSFSKSQKIINLRRRPRLTVLVERGTTYSDLQGVMIKGTALLDDDPARVLQLYGAMAAKYAMVGDEPVQLSREALEATFARHAAKNTAVTVQPEQVISWDHTKLGGTY
jgi:PPOX class probable F420-dependent enzyme